MAIFAKNKASEVPITTGILDVLASSTLKFEPKYIDNGDILQRILVVKNYPPEVGDAWLSKIVSLPGVIVSIHTEPTDAFQLISQIEKTMNQLAGRLETMNNQVARERMNHQYELTKKLLRKIDQEQQQVDFFTCVIAVYGEDMDELNYRTRKVEAALASRGMRARTIPFKQEQGLKSVGPWCVLDEEIKKFGARNMPIESIAASFPFVYSGINDGSGTLLGKDKDGGIVLVDPWIRDSSRTNSNITILGRPGVGKSTTVKKLILNEFARGTKIIIVDPQGEYSHLTKKLGGDVIDCGSGIDGRINPLQVRDVPIDDESDEKEKLYPEDTVALGPLALHFQTLRIFFNLYLGDLSKLIMNKLEVALEETYRAFQIDWSTDPKTIPNDKWPTILDLFAYVEQRYKEEKSKDWEELMYALRPAAIGADQFLWAGHTTINSNSDIVNLNIKQLQNSNNSIKRAQFFNIFSWAWQKITENPEEQYVLVSDETYILADPETPQALQFLRDTSKQIRKFEGGLWVITHNLIDFLDESIKRHGQALIDNPVYKILMGQGEKDIEALNQLMSLSEKEITTLSNGKRGEAIFIAGHKRILMNIKVSDHELEMFGKAGGR